MDKDSEIPVKDFLVKESQYSECLETTSSSIYVLSVSFFVLHKAAFQVWKFSLSYANH